MLPSFRLCLDEVIENFSEIIILGNSNYSIEFFIFKCFCLDKIIKDLIVNIFELLLYTWKKLLSNLKFYTMD